MWFLGHTALGFAFAGIVFALGRTHRFEVRVLVMVPFFANLIDFFHIEPIRPYSHSLLAAIGLPLLAILIWQRWMRWSRTEAIALLAASLGAIVGDLTFGSFYPFMPFVRLDVEWMEFNGVADLTTEALLGLGLIAVLLLLYVGRAGPRALQTFRGPWILAPAAAVLVTSAVLWGEVVTYVERVAWSSAGFTEWGVLGEMVLASALLTLLGILGALRKLPGSADPLDPKV